MEKSDDFINFFSRKFSDITNSIHKGTLRQPGYTTTSATDAAKEPVRRSVSVANSALPQR